MESLLTIIGVIVILILAILAVVALPAVLAPRPPAETDAGGDTAGDPPGPEPPAPAAAPRSVSEDGRAPGAGSALAGGAGRVRSTMPEGRAGSSAPQRAEPSARDEDHGVPALAGLDDLAPDIATTDTGPGVGSGAAAAVSAAYADEGPYAGSVLPATDGSAPAAEYTIKANVGSGRYHPPESPYFHRNRADFWFASANAAEAAGFVPWHGRPTTG